jgi:hypothetical protein
MNTKRIAYELRPYQAAAPGPAATRAPQAVKQALPPPPPTPVPAVSTPSAGGAPNRGTIARVVERFLAQKEVPRGTGTTAAPAPTPSAVASAPSPEPPKPKPVDFVSESDVATAVERSEKIVISPQTIVTPSARGPFRRHPASRKARQVGRLAGQWAIACSAWVPHLY